jgi:3D (Asp-Asp-Asp) domain-containing protein
LLGNFGVSWTGNVIRGQSLDLYFNTRRLQ